MAIGCGLVVGAGLVAFIMFFMNIYCENRANRPVTRQEAIAVSAYVLFGVVMLAVLWWMARSGARPDKDHKDGE